MLLEYLHTCTTQVSGVVWQDFEYLWFLESPAIAVLGRYSKWSSNDICYYAIPSNSIDSIALILKLEAGLQNLPHVYHCISFWPSLHGLELQFF